VILGLTIFVELGLVTDGWTFDDIVYCDSIASHAKNMLKVYAFLKDVTKLKTHGNCLTSLNFAKQVIIYR